LPPGPPPDMYTFMWAHPERGVATILLGALDPTRLNGVCNFRSSRTGTWSGWHGNWNVFANDVNRLDIVMRFDASIPLVPHHFMRMHGNVWRDTSYWRIIVQTDPPARSF